MRLRLPKAMRASNSDKAPSQLASLACIEETLVPPVDEAEQPAVKPKRVRAVKMKEVGTGGYEIRGKIVVEPLPVGELQ